MEIFIFAGVDADISMGEIEINFFVRNPNHGHTGATLKPQERLIR